MKKIDLRSDTVTRPTEGMIQAMMSAAVGDDVFGEDPTVLALEEKVADLFGMEAALFCPSGTMANQIAIKAHTQPGDEVVCDRLAHIYHYEGGGIAYNSGASVRLLNGDRGRFTAEELLLNINNEDVHHPRTSLVSIENTCNKGGGSIWRLEEIREIQKVCSNNKLKLHLDGARLFNALAETGESTKDYGMAFDSISICLSKGLGAPVGSVLAGTNDFINHSRRIRKVMGGGMRQAGYIAAAGIYALDNHRDRITSDHDKAKKLEEGLKAQQYIDEVLAVETNIVVAKLTDNISTQQFISTLQEKGIYIVPFGHQTIRMVTHLDVSDEMIKKVLDILTSLTF